MTNEERQHAIEWFKRRPVMMAGAKRMYDLAVEALEQPEIIRCEDCKYFELDHFEKADGFPIPIIVAHEICMKWGEGCKSSVDGWCFMAERRTDERTDSETGCG